MKSYTFEPPRYVTREEHQEMVRRYQSGESLRKIAAATGWGYITVRNHLRKAGVQLRSRGGK